MPDDVRYWFPAKRYGWGWGLPTTWEGWAVLAGFIVLVVAGIVLLPPKASHLEFFAYIGVLVVLLTAICWWKGEPPKWRWGGK